MKIGILSTHECMRYGAERCSADKQGSRRQEKAQADAVVQGVADESRVSVSCSGVQ